LHLFHGCGAVCVGGGRDVGFYPADGWGDGADRPEDRRAQGFANPELYKLAATQTYSSCSAESVTASSTTCLFNDIDGGTFASPYTNAMPCDYGYDVSGVDSPNCKANDSIQGVGDPIGILPGYSSNVGYDLATGLGSLNVANLVNAWPAISGGSAVTVTVTPAETSLILNQTLAVTGSVASTAAGGATPTGTVTLTAGSYTSKATLASGAYSFTVPANSLGAGSDTLSVAYSGSTTYSTASGEAIVTVEGTGATFSLNTPAPAVTPAGGVSPGSAASAAITVAAVAGYAGTVTVTCSLTTSPTGATDAPTCTGGGPTLAITLPNTTAQTLTFTVSTTAASTTTEVLKNLSRSRLRSRTLTRGSPRKPSWRLVMWSSMSWWMRSSEMPRALATRGIWKKAASGVMSGSRPEPEVVTRSMGTGLPGFSCGELVDGALDAVDERLVGLGQVGAAGGSGVVAVAGGRGARMEVLVGSEALRQQLRADDLAVLEDEASGGLVREDGAGDARDQQRIADAQQDGGHDGEAD
jgi:hypothetical protein